MEKTNNTRSKIVSVALGRLNSGMYMGHIPHLRTAGSEEHHREPVEQSESTTEDYLSPCVDLS